MLGSYEASKYKFRGDLEVIADWFESFIPTNKCFPLSPTCVRLSIYTSRQWANKKIQVNIPVFVYTGRNLWLIQRCEIAQKIYNERPSSVTITIDNWRDFASSPNHS